MQVRVEVEGLMTDVLKEQRSYKVYFELETSYILNTIGTRFRCFRTKPEYLAKEQGIQEIYKDALRDLKRCTSTLSVTVEVQHMSIMFAKSINN